MAGALRYAQYALKLYKGIFPLLNNLTHIKGCN